MLPAEELVTMIEPIEGMLGAIIGGELQLVEARRVNAVADTRSCWFWSKGRGRRGVVLVLHVAAVE